MAPNTYTLELDANGGELLGADSNGKLNQKVESGKQAQEPIQPTSNEGKVFQGWVDADDETPFDFSTPVTSNKSIKVAWLQQHTVTFNASTNGGTTSTPSTLVNDGDILNLSNYTATPSDTTYTFVGWAETSGTTGVLIQNPTITEDKTLYAVFSKTVSATFKANNNKINNNTTDIVKNCTRYNNESTCSITTPTITANGNNTPTVVGYTTSSAGVSTATILSASPLSIAGGEIYFAHTKKNAVTKQVTFNPNGNTKFKYGSNAESTSAASYDLCTIAETYDGEGQASNCSKSVTCPKITASANTPTVIGWSEGVTDRNTVCTSEGTATLEGGKTYYAQTKKPSETFTATFEKNGAASLSKYTDSCSLLEVWNGETRSETCNVTAPTITRDGWTTLGFNTDKFAESATFEQGVAIPLSSDTTYYAITKKEAIDLTANVDGNNSTLSSNEGLTCTLEAVYNTGTQKTSCEVTMPTVTANTNTPNFIGWNTPSTSKTNNASYNTTTNKLTLTASNTNATWYAITNSDDKVLHITYEIGTGVASIGKITDSCTLTGTYNGEAQATSCTVEAPSITVSEGYKDSDKKWTESGTNIIANVGANITLTQDSHYTAGAKYIANTNPMDDLQYTIRYEDQNGKTLKSSDTIVNQTFGTAVTVTAPDIAGYVTPSSQNITIAVTNSDVVFVYAPRTNIEYTVTYKDTNGNTLLTTKTVNTGVMDTEVSENAPEIDGYTVQTGTLSITLKATNNHIDFVYNPNNNISYTVYYKSGDVTLHTAKTVNNKTMAEIVTEYAENILGYTVDENQKSLTLAATNNTITFNYTPNTNISYTVKYQTSNGSGLSEDKVVDSQTMASTVNEDAIEIVGYTVDENQKSLTLAATNNVITFTYTPIEYAIRFVDESNIHPTIVRSGNYLSVVNQNYPEWTRPGYAIHWDKSIPETMPLEGLTITASWTANTYTVSFNANQSGVSNPENKSVTYNSAYGILPSLSKDGYTFNGWKDGVNFVTSETVYTTVGNKTLTGDWTANTNTIYKIEHYKEKLDGTYEKVLTEDKTGETDTTATATPKTDYEGFTYSGDVEGTKVSGNIEGNGSLVLKLFYTRNSYDVEYQFANTPSGHSSLPATVSHKYGATVSIAENATAPGYSFAWDRTESFTMPTEDVTITGTFTANTTTPYAVQYYYQQANGEYLSTPTATDTTRKGTTDQTASVTNEDKTPTESGYAFDAANTNNVLEGTIAGNESLVLKVYFKKQFTVTYKKGNKGTFEDVVYENLDYNTSTPNNDSELTGQHLSGYTFNGWSPERLENVTGDQTYTATWSANTNTPYTVEIYEQQADGTWLQTPTKTIDRSGTTDTTAEVTTSDRIKSGYALDESKANILSGNIEGNGSLVLKVYLKKQFTVTYKPGEHGTFSNDEHFDLDYGTSTPAFAGDTNSHEDGYVFSGWDSEVSATVTSNATYIAIWGEDKNHDNQNDEFETKYTVTFVAGENGELEGTLVYDNILSGYTLNTIASFQEPTKTPNTNYIFKSWSPELDKTVKITGNVIYTGLFAPDFNANNIDDETESHFTITYTDGVDGEEIFADQTTENILTGLSAPAFEGTPSRENYIFAGWTPSITAKVTKNQTYTATWYEDFNHDGQNDAEETKIKVTFLEGVHGSLNGSTNGKIEYQVLSGLTLGGVDGYEEPTVTPDTDYMFSGWNKVIDTTSPLIEDVTYTAIYGEDKNHDGQNDAKEDKYTVTITYVYSRGGEAKPTYTLENQLSGFTYNVDSPAIANYHADKLNLSGKITGNVNEVVTYTPNNDSNHDGYADEGESKYTITVYYNYSKGGKAADTQSGEYLNGIEYSFTSPDVDYYTPDVAEVSGATTGTVNYTVIYSPVHDVNNNEIADEEETPFTVRFLPGNHGTLGGTTEYLVLSGLKLSDIEGYQTPTTTANTHYVFSGWSPSLNINSKVLSDKTYTAIWGEDKNGDGNNDEFETKYTVIYKDGVDGSVFADDIHSLLLSGTTTPTHTNPTRINYVFNGWNPAVAEKVTANATYTATWKVDSNNNGVADEDETYTLTINYVYSKGGNATGSYVASVLSGAEYSVNSPNVTNYQTTDTLVSGTMPGENKTITVIYTPVTDANGNNVADEEEAKYTLTIQYHDTKGNTVYSDYIAQYVAGASYEKVSQTKEHYTIISGDTVSGVMPANNLTLTVIYSANLDANDNGIADQNETHYTLTIHYVNAQNGTLYPDYSGSYVAGAEYIIASNTSDTNYTIESGKEIVNGIMPAQNTIITVTYTAKNDANGNGVADEDEPHHTLTIHYKNSKGVTLFPNHTESIVKGASYIVNSPEKTHYTIDKPIVSGTMGEENITVTVTYNTATADTNDNGIADEDETAHQLTITYKYSRGEQASETVTANYLSGISYSIASPIIANYTANITTVEGVMGDADRTINVIYTPDVDENHNGIADVLDTKYTATVHYVYSRGGVAHADKTQQDILSGLNYSIISPYIEHYIANKQTVSGIITGENVEFTVTYTPVTDENHDGYADEDEIKYAVTYKDGADGSVFTSKVFNNILSGTTTPAYNGSLTRTDYLFSGWTPSIAEKVTGNAAYTATWKEDMNNNGIDDDTEDKYTITIKDGDTIISTQEVVSGAKIKLPETPTKNGYTFDGWDGLPEDGRFHGDAIVLTAKWKQNSSNTNTTGGGGGSSSSSSIKDTNKNTDKNKNEKEHNSANLSGENLTGNKVEDKTITEENDDNINKNSLEEKIDGNTSNNQNNSILQKTPITNRYSQEVLDAYKWAYSKNITTMDLDNANPEGWLYRQHMAKMIVNFAVNVLGKEIPEKSPRKCLWKDGPNSFESKEMEEYALKACKLGLMGIDMDYFQPRLPVTRAQFGTILSRLLYGTKYAGGTPYYRKHLNALKKEGIMTKTDKPENRMELREWVWVMLMRVKDLEKN